MDKNLKLISLILVSTLIFSCAERKSTEKANATQESAITSKLDSLKFTSGIRAILQDSKGHYWFGSHNEGLAHYDGASFEYFTTNEGLQDDQIRSIQEDNNGLIWIGTSKGVNSYNGEEFTSYLTEFNSPRSDWNATTGSLWFYAGEKDGINRYDGEWMNYLIFPKPKNIDPNNSFGVTGISMNKEGKTWIATYSALFSYDEETVDVFENEKLKLEDDHLLHIRSVLADSKGRIWIGNNGIGVIMMKGDSITHFSKEQGKLLPIREFEENIRTGQLIKNTGLQSVFAIEEDSEGNIWFGDRDSGAWKYNGKTILNYPLNDSRSNPMIWTIYLDNANNLLFGIAAGGVYRFNGDSFDRMF